jgi:hypothetical protein
MHCAYIVVRATQTAYLHGDGESSEDEIGGEDAPVDEGVLGEVL